MKSIKITKSLFAAVMTLSLLAAAGCSSQSSQTSETDSADAPKTEFVIADDKAGSKTVYLVNNSGQNIIGLSAWPVGGVFGSETLLGEGQIVKNGEQSAWNLPDYSEEQSKYYIEITLEDGTNFILRDIDLAAIPQNGQVAVNYKDQTGYVIYQDTNNKTVDTYDWEVSQKDQPYEEFIDDSDALIGIPVDD